jgi:hypothetical protein
VECRFIRRLGFDAAVVLARHGLLLGSCNPLPPRIEHNKNIWAGRDSVNGRSNRPYSTFDASGRHVIAHEEQRRERVSGPGLQQ